VAIDEHGPERHADAIRAYLAAFLDGDHVSAALEETLEEAAWRWDSDLHTVARCAHATLHARAGVDPEAEAAVLVNILGLPEWSASQIVGLTLDGVRAAARAAPGPVEDAAPAVESAEDAARAVESAEDAAPALEAGTEAGGEAAADQPAPRRQRTSPLIRVVLPMLAVGLMVALAALGVANFPGTDAPDAASGAPGALATIRLEQALLVREVGPTGEPGAEPAAFRPGDRVLLWLGYTAPEGDGVTIEVGLFAADGQALARFEVWLPPDQTRLTVPLSHPVLDDPGQYEVVVAHGDRPLVTRFLRIEP
jgi:hypothetical protein